MFKDNLIPSKHSQPNLILKSLNLWMIVVSLAKLYCDLRLCRGARRSSVFCLAFGLLLTSFLAQAQSDTAWWDASWNYRVPLQFESGEYERIDRPVEISLNFTQQLVDVGVAGQFDPASIRVVEIDEIGQIVNADVPFQFDPDAEFENTTNASGNLIFLAQGTTPVISGRNYHVYFDLETAAIPPALIANQISITDGVIDEGQAAIQVDTPAATYLYQKSAAGFSSLIDIDGNDWIDHNPTGGSAGSFRGIPNLVYPEGHFHPGATSSVTTILNQGPIKVTIHSITTDTLWEGIWEIFPTHARFSVLRADHDYWFLYEGTPGGLLEEDSDFVVRSDGTQSLLSEAWTLDLADNEWVYFADPAVERSLFLANHSDDTAIDSYRPQDGLMTVFGFGRDNLNSLLGQVPAEFSVSLVDSTDFNSTSRTGLSSYKELAVSFEQTQTLTQLAAGIVIQPLPVTVADGGRVVVRSSPCRPLAVPH